jgi:hypothetical protein
VRAAVTSLVWARLRRRPTPTGVVVAVLCAWFVALVVLIHRSPSQGAPTPAALAGAFGAAVRTGDERAASRLVYDAPGDAVATLLRDARCGGPRTTVTVGRASLLLHGPGGAVCGWLPVAAHDGRWLIDPWAVPVRPPG